MIPEIEPAIAHRLVENCRHADGQRGRPARAAEERFLTDGSGEPIHLLDGDGKAQRRHLGGRLFRRPFDVHAQINARIERAGGDQGHDGDQRFQAHRAVADGPRIGLAGDEFGGRAARDERVKSGDRAAGNRDETEGKHRAGKYGPRAVDEAADRGKFQCGQNQEHAQRQGEDRPEFHEGAKVITRGEQQPDRKNTGGQTVKDDRPRQRDVVHREDFCPARVGVNELSTPHGQQQEDHPHG